MKVRNFSKIALGVLLLALSIPTITSASAEQLSAQKEQVTAAMLYSFAKFIRWPEIQFLQEDIFMIGILGDEPGVERQLGLISKRKTIGGRKILVQSFPEVSEVTPSHILYIAGAQDLTEVMSELRYDGLLTVAEIDGFASLGGNIELYTGGESINFKLNLKSSKRNGLEISRELQELASSVIQ